MKSWWMLVALWCVITVLARYGPNRERFLNYHPQCPKLQELQAPYDRLLTYVSCIGLAADQLRLDNAPFLTHTGMVSDQTGLVAEIQKVQAGEKNKPMIEPVYILLAVKSDHIEYKIMAPNMTPEGDPPPTVSYQGAMNRWLYRYLNSKFYYPDNINTCVIPCANGVACGFIYPVNERPKRGEPGDPLPKWEHWTVYRIKIKSVNNNSKSFSQPLRTDVIYSRMSLSPDIDSYIINGSYALILDAVKGLSLTHDKNPVWVINPVYIDIDDKGYPVNKKYSRFELSEEGQASLIVHDAKTNKDNVVWSIPAPKTGDSPFALVLTAQGNLLLQDRKGAQLPTMPSFHLAALSGWGLPSKMNPEPEPEQDKVNEAEVINQENQRRAQATEWNKMAETANWLSKSRSVNIYQRAQEELHKKC